MESSGRSVGPIFLVLILNLNNSVLGTFTRILPTLLLIKKLKLDLSAIGKINLFYQFQT